MNSLEAVYQQLKMVEKDIRFLVDQIERFDLYPVVKPQDYVDPDSGEPDDTWLYPCKVCEIDRKFSVYGKMTVEEKTCEEFIYRALILA